MKMSQLASLIFVALVVVTFPATAATIHVPGEEPTIQAGIDAASAGDTVLVARGTYYEHDIVMKSGVHLTSETGLANCVEVTAQRLARVFYCDGVNGPASIVGFTISDGCEGMGSTDNGGGMYCISSSLALTNCAFSGNEVGYGHGGGMYCISSSPTLTDCTFSGNQAGYDGGGMYCWYSSPTLTNCTFSGNQAGYGGGMSCDGSSFPTLTGCTFSENHATSAGGGMSCDGFSIPTLTGCRFSGNWTRFGGGGMYCVSSFPTLTSCTFSENEIAYASGGGGMYCGDSSSPTLTGCIISFSTQGEAVYCHDASSSPVLTCCDVYGNAGGDWIGCIADQYGVDGNFSEDPLFCDMYSDDFTLCANSPCLPDSTGCGLVGAHGQGCVDCVSPVEMNSWGAIKSMYR